MNVTQIYVFKMCENRILENEVVSHMKANDEIGKDSAYSSIGAIGAICTGPPQNGGLQISYIWSDFVRFGEHLDIIFQKFTFH